jgi:hypothetical protein
VNASVAAVTIGLIGANRHFLSDMIVGVFVGNASGWMITTLCTLHERFVPTLKLRCL